MDNEFKLKNGSGCLCCKGCGRQDKQLNTYDWLADIPGNTEEPVSYTHLTLPTTPYV